MRKRTIGSWTLAAAALLAAASARADDAPAALEATVGLGFDRGFGSVGDGIPRLQDTGAAGSAMELGVGWRIEPHFTVGVYGGGSVHAAGKAVPGGARGYGASAGFAVSYHGQPGARVDPWIGLGVGWRGYWVERDAGTDVLAGIDVTRIQAGVDYAMSDRMSVSPVLGVSLTRFQSRKAAGDASYQDIAAPRTAAFVFAGVLARFEVVGSGPAHRAGHAHE